MPVTRAVAVVALSLGLIGCAENRASFFVEMIKVPTGECVVESNEEGMYRTAGTLDLAFSGEYLLTPLMANQLSERGDSDSLVAETNGILVEGANIRIWQGGRPQGSAFYSFYQPASSYVPPQDVTASVFVALPEQATTALILYRFPEYGSIADIPVTQLAGYQDLVTIGVRMLGTTNGGLELETPEFFFTVHLCYGCLVVCTTESLPEGSTTAYCEGTDAPEEPPCSLGQDDPIDCRFCTAEFGDPDLCRAFCGI
jgi:hypothetical protein